jgi:hypothetical protein
METKLYRPIISAKDAERKGCETQLLFRSREGKRPGFIPGFPLTASNQTKEDAIQYENRRVLRQKWLSNGLGTR